MICSLLAIGDIALDVVLGPIPALPNWGEEVEVPTVDARLGGNLGNFLVAARRLGLDVAAAGLLGDDENGRRLMRDMRSLGCPSNLLRVIQGGTTPVSIGFFRHDGERMFVTYPGVLAELGSLIAPSALPAAKVLFLTGWCQPPRIDARALSSFCRRYAAQGTQVVMDLSWNSASWEIRQDLLSVLSEVDVVLMNRDELAALSGTADVNQGLTQLGMRLGARASVIAKLGADGAVARHGNGDVARAKSPVVGPVSAVGAGDSFNAGFVAARFMRGLDFEAALVEACAFASDMMRAGRDRIGAAPGE